MSEHQSYEPCPVARAVSLVGDRWSLLIVRDAFDGVRRFGDFQRSLGVARNILSDRLQKLVIAGILKMQPASDGSAYQEYVLTEKGERAFPIVVAMRQWGEQHLFGPGEQSSQLVDKQTGEPIAYMAPVSNRGTILTGTMTAVQKISR